MATFYYYLYRTDYDNTLIDKSLTSFTITGTTGQIYSDYLIPETQPLYNYKESGGAIVPNDESNVEAWRANIYPTNEDDKVIYEDFTGYTSANDIRVTNVETAIQTVDGKVDAVSASTSANTEAIIDQQLQFTGYTANTATKRILVVNNTVQDLNTIAGVNVQWDIILRQDSDYFAFTAGTDSITILEDGEYDVAMSVPMDYAGGGNQINNVGIVILINGTADVDTYISATVNKDRQQTASLPNVEHMFTAGDVINVEGYSLNGSTSADTVAGSVWFQITKVNA